MHILTTLLDKFRQPVELNINKWGLKAKLVGIMLALSFTCALTLFILDSKGVKEIANAVQSQNEDLSQAFQISVDEITTQGFTNQARLQDFITTLKRKGVKEISILSNEREVLESSNPQKVGKVIPPKHKDFLVTGALGDDEGEEGAKRKIYNLVIPVVIKDEQLGYVNLKLHLEDFDSLLDNLRVRRLFAIVAVFALGVVGAIFLASRYTQPIGALVSAARRVAAGDLDQQVDVKKEQHDEISQLTETFNEMIAGLRENQQLQKKLARAEHLSSLGQFSAGIAHEIRNPLNYLSLSLDQLRDKLASGGDVKKMQESVIRMKSEIQRLSHLVKNFLTYGKPLTINKTKIDAKDIIDDSFRMVSDRVSDQNIIVEKNIQNGLQFFADKELLKSCLTNVILNAVQAVPLKGKLEIFASRNDKHDKIIIKDNGCGIAIDKQSHIGEPFFSTKDAGVGVGLAITKKILTEHGGAFHFASEEGKGTTVTMSLPIG